VIGMSNQDVQRALNFCRRYPPPPRLLPFHYELLCRRKLEKSLRRFRLSRKIAKAIARKVPFKYLPRVTPEEIGRQ